MNPSKVLADILDSATGAKVHFEMWWAMAGDARGELKQAMRSNTEYFAAAWDAHYIAFFVCLAHLFDKRIDSSSIPTYLSILESEGGREDLAEVRVAYEQLVARADPLIKARHKTVAHIDAKKTSAEFFTSVEIIWKDVRSVLNDSVSLVVRLANSQDPSELGIPRDGMLRDATFKVLQALHETELKKGRRLG